MSIETELERIEREARERGTNPSLGAETEQERLAREAGGPNPPFEHSTTMNTSPQPPKVADALEDVQGKQDIQNANDERKAVDAGVVEVVKGPGAGTGPGGSAP